MPSPNRRHDDPIKAAGAALRLAERAAHAGALADAERHCSAAEEHVERARAAAELPPEEEQAMRARIEATIAALLAAQEEEDAQS